MGAFIRFDEQFMRSLRGAVDLPALIGRDVALRPAGVRRYKGCCPFHDERTPSFFVDGDSGFYRCFGCNSTGDAIEWMKRHHGMTFHEAAILLARQEGVLLPPEPSEPDDVKQLRREAARLRHALEEATRIFRRGFARHPDATRYLFDQRGLDQASIDKFELGVVGSGILPLLVHRYPRELLLGAGLAFESEDGRLIDRFRHRVVMPIRSAGGALVSFAGRVYDPSDRRETKYLNGPETALFRKGEELYGLHHAIRAIRRTRSAVVVEGYFDVIALHKVGEDRAVAPMGTAMSSSQLERLLRLVDSLIFAFDGDSAGRRAARAAASASLGCLRDGQSIHFVFLPAAADPDSFVRAVGYEGWLSAIADALPLSAVLIQEAVGDADLRVAEFRAKAAHKAREVVARVQGAPLFARALQLAFESAIGIPLE